jgi:hypothetical protein
MTSMRLLCLFSNLNNFLIQLQVMFFSLSRYSRNFRILLDNIIWWKNDTPYATSFYRELKTSPAWLCAASCKTFPCTLSDKPDLPNLHVLMFYAAFLHLLPYRMCKDRQTHIALFSFYPFLYMNNE